jgi:hypothetical protein
MNGLMEWLANLISGWMTQRQTDSLVKSGNRLCKTKENIYLLVLLH